MRTKQIATWLPCFSGFYGTIWQPDETNEIEYINQERDRKGFEPITFDDCKFDYDDYHNQVITGIARRLEVEYLKPFVKGIKIERLVSPREYNFANDSANITVTLCAANEKRIMKFLSDHKQAFTDSLKQSYTSCSGFISSYPNYIDGYMEGKPLEHEHKLGYILQFIASTVCEHAEGVEWELYYDVEKYLSCMNYEELINGNS